MDDWRLLEELERMEEWDADAVCDALNITAPELIAKFQLRAIKWVEDNCE